MTPSDPSNPSPLLLVGEDQMIENAFQEMLQIYLNSNHRKKTDKIKRAFDFARKAHAGTRRRSGEPYIMHPIAVARIVVSELGLGSTSICAALLHDVVEDTEYTTEDLEMNFGPRIAQIVDGLTKISGGIFGTHASLQAENFRKLLLSMSSDVRVVLIKMADRLHNMRTLGAMRPDKQAKIAGETLYIYAPLAHRLGLFKIKQELEDLAFRFEHPAKYEEILSLIDSSREHREKIVEEFVAPVRKKLDEAGIKYEIKARVKSAYSIYKKMERKKLAFQDIYDIYAVRVIFDNDDDSRETLLCWQIYTYFAEGHSLHPDRLRDWTTTPKPNGYRALHLTVMGPEGRWIEVQIRSRKMDEVAELGYAAHWKYKTGEYDEEPALEQLMSKVREILANPTPNAIDFLDTVTLNLFSADIYVFTPKGDLITLPSGSTVLDMAFAIHTEVGKHCVAGKIAHKLYPRNHQLQSGDQVERITSESQSPEHDWIKSCKTLKARNSLRALLRRDKGVLTRRGKELFDQFVKDQNMECTPETMSAITAHYHLAGEDELYQMLAADEINLSTTRDIARGKAEAKTRTSVLSRLLRNPFTRTKKTEAPGKVNPDEVYILLPNATPPNYRLGKCCSPIPGDDVIGFISVDGAVVVHKADCEEAMKLKTTYGTRIVQTRWEGKSDNFDVTIEIDGIDRIGLLQDMLQIISDKMKINIRNMKYNTRQEVFNCVMDLRVDTVDTVQAVLRDLKKTKGVKLARRMS